MKRAFIRAIWGDVSKNGIRNGKMSKDIQLIKENPYNEPFVVYVFGSENYEELTRQGFECKLIDELPVKYDVELNFWRHKLDIFKYAMEDFDEIVFLDWDCRPTKKLPDDFWERMSKKAVFQANLFQYRTKRCLWRKEEWRKTCNGGFVYMADKSIPQEIINIYDELCKWVDEKRELRKSKGQELRFREKIIIFDDEPAMSKYVDNLTDGWLGADYYWENYEPEFCNVKRSAYSQELLKEKDECFFHLV